MKNVIKSILFVVIFILICIVFGALLLPWHSVKEYGLYKSTAYEILWEPKDSIDAVYLGDSLIYNSISPMEIYNEYGFATFDCIEAAQLIKNSYEYLKVAIDNQHPNVVFFETNVLFRNPNYKPIYVKAKTIAKNIIPVYKYHNNWKKISLTDTYADVNYYKGYKPSMKKLGVHNHKPRKVKKTVPEYNMKYFEKIIKLCEENNVKLVLISTPSKNNWSEARHEELNKLSKKYNIEFLDLNSLEIDWRKDTKDYGEHLNYEGAKKVSHYVGNYLKQNNLAEDRRNDEAYKVWDAAYKKYQESFKNKTLMA